MISSLSVRKLKKPDIKVYKSLRLLSLQTDPNAFHLLYEQAKSYDDAFFLKEIESEEHSVFGFYGAFFGRDLVGMISFQSMESHMGHIFTFYVNPLFRKRGIGFELISFVVSLASRENISVLKLTVVEGNPAVALYESLGFVCTAKNVGAFTSSNGIFNELTFQRQL